MNFENKIQITKWWSTIDNLVEVPKNYREQKEKFFDLFNNACNLRMRSDVKIATSLSGGVDLSSIVAAINQIKIPIFLLIKLKILTKLLFLIIKMKKIMRLNMHPL